MNKKLLMINIASTLAIMLVFISFGIPRSTFDTYDYTYIKHSTTTPLSNEATITKKDFNLTYVKWISFWKPEGYTYGNLGIHYNITFLWNNPFDFNVSADIKTSYNPQNGASYSVQHGVYVNGTQLNRSSLISVQPLQTIKIDYYDVVEWFNLESLNDTETLNRELKVSEEGIIEGAKLRFIFPKENWQTVLAKYPQSFSTKTDTWTETEKVYLGCLFHSEVFIPYLIDGLLFSGLAALFEWSFVKKKLRKILLLNFVASLIVCGLAALLMWLGYYLPYAIGSPIGNFAWLTLGIIFYGLGFWGMIIITSILMAFIFCMAFTVAIWIVCKILKKTSYWFKKD